MLSRQDKTTEMYREHNMYTFLYDFIKPPWDKDEKKKGGSDYKGPSNLWDRVRLLWKFGRKGMVVLKSMITVSYSMM